MWKRCRLEVVLPAAALAEPRAAVVRHLTRRLGRHNAQLDGVPLEMANAKILNGTSAIRNDRADLYADVAVDVFVFRPKAGDRLVATVNRICETHLSALAHGIFNAVVRRPSDPSEPSELSEPWPGDALRPGDPVALRVVEADLEATPPRLLAVLDDGPPPSPPPAPVGGSRAARVILEATDPEFAEPVPRKRPAGAADDGPRAAKASTTTGDRSSSDSEQSEEELGGVGTLQNHIIKRIMAMRKSR